jgi:Holliday junction resolvase|tara:strand:- start:736 stop:1188 length:453 start_codon:yes stop_codon:yes gene_type:complete
MVDSRAKGARGEYLVRDMLRQHTGLKFERVPASGALEYLKGDLYVPNCRNYFCIEVKNYKDSPLTDKLFTQPKTNNLIRWWNKIILQARGGNQKPLLFFRYDRSKVFVCTEELPRNTAHYICIRFLNTYVMLAEEWLEYEEIKFTDGYSI